MAGRTFPYGNFVGLDTISDPNAMSDRFFTTLKGAHVDFRGQVVRDGGSTSLGLTFHAQGFLRFNGVAANNDLVHIAGVSYFFKTTLTAGGLANEVLIGANQDASLTNLAAAVNDDGTEGTQYGIGTQVNPSVVAGFDTEDDVLTVTALVAGTGGNSIITTTTGVNLTWDDATLTGGSSTGATDVRHLKHFGSEDLVYFEWDGTRYNAHSLMGQRFDGIFDVAASGVVTVSAVSNNNTVTIGSRTYTFKTTLTGAANEVLIGGTGTAAMLNLAHAINDDGVEGTNYGTGTLIHDDVSAEANALTCTVTAKVAGAAGNSIATTDNSTTISWADPTLTGGGTDQTAYSTLGAVHFVNKLYLFADDVGSGIVASYDGKAFAYDIETPNGVGFTLATTVLNRMAVAGIADAPTELRLTKLDEFDFDTGGGSPTAADGAIIDIKNQLSGKDEIKGLGVLEGDKLVIFCANETLIYKADPDVRLYSIIRDFRVPIGTIGRKTIQPVGSDLFFCSQFGVHSIRRAISGLTLETISMSRIVNTLYTELIEAMPAGAEPRAVWNPNLAQYQIFFPTTDEDNWSKLSLVYEPGAGRGSFQSWSFDDAGHITDAGYFAGSFVGASVSEGVTTLDVPGDTVDTDVVTPILWQGAPEREKQYKRLLMRVSGTVSFTVKAYNERGNLLQQYDLTAIDAPALGSVPSASPAIRPFDLPFNHRARGVRFEFLATGSGRLKILDFAVVLRG